MGKRKIKVRFFTIADFKKEARWLEEEHRKGWRFTKVFFFFYLFEKCAPAQAIYRLDFTNKKASEDYVELYRDYGWDYLDSCNNFHYFRKMKDAVNFVDEGEIFSNSESQIRMIDLILKRLLFAVTPSVIILLFYYYRYRYKLILFLLVIWLILFIYCILNLKALRKDEKNKEI